MGYMRIFPFRFVGYQNFDQVQDKLEQIFKEHFGYHDPNFMQAVIEAVLNAAKYSKAGLMEAEISLDVEITSTDLSVVVRSDNIPFDANEFQAKLRRLASDPKYSNLDWGDYTLDTDMSRGYWFMLMACDYVLVESDMSIVKLSARIPFKERRPDRTIGFLVPKLFVRTRGVVA